MLSLLLFACGSGNGTDDTKADDTGGTDAPECTDDAGCGIGQICEGELCVDGDRDNSPETATPILWGDTLGGVLNPDGDVDYFAFEAEGGEYLRALTVVSDPEIYDTVLTIRKPNGKVVTSADAYATGSAVTGEDAVAFAYLDEAGTYVLTVEDVVTADGGAGTGSPEYEYTVTLAEWSDATEETDSAESPRLTVDLSDERIWNAAGFLLESGGDVDYIRLLHVLDGQNLYIDGNEDLSGSDLSPTVRLWDESGILYGEKVNFGLDEYLLYPHLPEGDYVVELADQAAAGGPNTWGFAHIIVRPDSDGYVFTDEAEPNADTPSATPLDLTLHTTGDGQPYQQAQGVGTIEGEGDEDWFVVDYTYEDGGLVLCLVSSFFGSTLTPSVELYDTEGHLLDSADGTDGYPTLVLDNTNTDGTPRYLRVTGAASGPSAWYRFYLYAASFSIADYADGGYSCP